MLAPRYYRISPELRRSAWYTFVGFLLAAGLTRYVLIPLQQRDPGDATVVCTVFVLIAASMLLPLRWCLRVDDEGVARRMLLSWDVWTWDDFASGSIGKRHGFIFVDPARRWPWRTLWLDFLTADDRQDVLRMIHAYYELPLAPNCPKSLKIAFQLNSSATFEESGVKLHIEGKDHQYRWEDVRRLRIVRLDPVRRDFRLFQLTLPDRFLEWTRSQKEPPGMPWRGASAEELNELLLSCMPAERVVIDVVGEVPAQREDVERELERIKKKQREFRYVMGTCATLIPICLVASLFVCGFRQALFMSFVVAIHSPIFWLSRHGFREHIRQLETMLVKFPAEAQGTPEKLA